MAITIQMLVFSSVTELFQDAFLGSSLENPTTIFTFYFHCDFLQELGTQATLFWREASFFLHVYVHPHFSLYWL